MQIGVLTAKLTLDTADFTAGAEGASRSAKGLGDSIAGLNFKQIGTEIAGVGAVLAGAFGAGLALAVKAASDLNESMSKSQVVFGESAKAIADWSKTAATSMGLSQQAAVESAATFGNLFTAMGLAQPAAAKMSTNLVQLAADLASFNNQDPSEMLIKLRSGLVGEVEPLRSVGVQMNEATVQAKAMEMGFGRTKAEISEGEKVLARYAIILDQTQTAQGDFGRTSDGVANQLRIMKARSEDLLASLGTGLLPAVSGGLSIFNNLLALLTGLPDELKNVAVAVVGVTTAVGASLVVIGGLVALLGGPLTLTIVAVVGTIAALTAAVALEWNRIKAIFGGGVSSVGLSFKQMAGILGAAADAFAILARIAVMQFDAIVQGVKLMVIAVSGAFNALRNSLAPAMAGLVTGNMTMFAAGLMNIGTVAKETFSEMGSSMSAFKGRMSQDIQDIKNRVGGGFRAAFEKAADGVSSSIGKINKDLTGLADGLSNSAKAAGAHGKAHADAAAKAAAAWTIAQLRMKEDLTLIAELHQKTGEMILTIKQKQDEDWLKQNLKWGMDALKQLQDFQKNQDEELSKVINSKAGLAALEDLKKITEAAKTFATESGLATAKAALETRSNIQSAIQTFREYGEMLGLTGQALETFVDKNLRESMSKIPGVTKEAIDAAIKATKDGLIKLPGIWEEAFGKLPASIKGPMASAIGLIDAMPGHFGDAARKILKTAEGWIDFANKTLAAMHSLNDNVPASLGGMVTSVIGVFQKLFKKVGDVQQEGQKDSEDSAKDWAAKIMATVQGVMTFMATRHQGKAAGVMGGMMAGMGIGSAFGGPIGGAIGAGIGAIAGLFGSGKSAEQKAEEERQKKQIAMDMERTAIDITGTAMDVMKKALDTFKALADHVDVPRAAIKSFFATLEKVTHEFLSLAGKFAKDNMDAAKVFAESMGPVIDLMGGALQAFEGLRFYTAIPAQAIQDLADDIGKAAELMGALAADIEANVVKKAMKFSKQMQFVVEMIGTAVESFVKLMDYKGVATYIMGWFFQDLQTATDMMGKIADDTSRNMLNKAKTYAERISVIVQAIGTAVTALTSLRTYESVPQMAFDALQHDVLAALGMIDGLVSAADMYLDKALTFEELVKRIVGALDSGVSLIRSVGGSALSGEVTVTPGSATSSIRSAGGSPGSASGGLTIGELHFSGDDPRTQRAVAAIEDLLGSRGFPMAAKAY